MKASQPEGKRLPQDVGPLRTALSPGRLGYKIIKREMLESGGLEDQLESVPVLSEEEGLEGGGIF